MSQLEFVRRLLSGRVVSPLAALVLFHLAVSGDAAARSVAGIGAALSRRRQSVERVLARLSADGLVVRSGSFWSVALDGSMQQDVALALPVTSCSMQQDVALRGGSVGCAVQQDVASVFFPRSAGFVDELECLAAVVAAFEVSPCVSSRNLRRLQRKRLFRP